MLNEILNTEGMTFTTHAEAEGPIAEACAKHPEIARFEHIGHSEAGRPLYAAMIGKGPRHVSLVAGAHADEPVGPEVLRLLCVGLIEHREALAELLERVTFIIVPHVNPDGEAANQPWIERWPDPLAFAEHAVRERPGRDIEFGYPEMRPENQAVAVLLRQWGPIDLHFSLHGMAVGEGAWLLIDRHWRDRTADLKQRWVEAVQAEGLGLLDWDRQGEKGFEYLGPGFSTTPRGEAMRARFEALGDAETAKLFHDSSMEFVRKLGGDPLCLVTELPLFVGPAGATRRDTRQPNQPLHALPLPIAAKLQLRLIELGLQAVGLQ
ncbi:MAG: M14 family zinc carboxypeptidase [Phycisphaeraceae bacterium]